jgi:hypothetical protein
MALAFKEARVVIIARAESTKYRKPPRRWFVFIKESPKR